MDHYAADVQPDPVEFPNTVMRRRTSVTQPDDMAEVGPGAGTGTGRAFDFSRTGDQPRSDEAAAAAAAAAATATAAGESVAGDVDTCRICRGEGASGEPLFYPCKCSGSIKYVHQDCLMEWLSHSQKKHCELCKTPFRFTKLYSPTMPKSLPFYVFASHMAKYTFANILVWLRAALVVSVWLGWLPYLMRSVWSFLFWISDEGFGPTSASFPLPDAGGNTEAHMNLVAHALATQGLTSNICPASPLFTATMTAANKAHIAERVPNLLPTMASPPSLNMTTFNSFAASLARFISGADVLNGTHMSWDVSKRQETLLSEVGFLKNLTPHPAVNKVVIKIFEGQIITILVIVCFILIILVRDYVVQQQPEINMRAAFAAQVDNAGENQDRPQVQQIPEARNEDIPAVNGVGRAMDENTMRDDESTIAHGGETTDSHGDGDKDEQPAWRRDIDAIEENVWHNDLAPEDFRDELWDATGGRPWLATGVPPERPIAGFRRRLTRRDTGEDVAGGSIPSRPDSSSAPGRGRLDNGVREKLLEELDEQSQSTVNQYLRIYRQANGDRERILRIIHDEGLGERLAYWVNATQSMTQYRNGTGLEAGASVPSTSFKARSQPSSQTQPELAHDSDNHGSSVLANNENVNALGSHQLSAPQDKGKQRAIYGDTQQAAVNIQKLDNTWQWPQSNGSGYDSDETAAEDNDVLPSSPTRPRAVSDGPLIHNRINPLANNSWSFSALPISDSEAKPEAALPPETPVLKAVLPATPNDVQRGVQSNGQVPAGSLTTPNSNLTTTSSSDTAPAGGGQTAQVETVPVEPVEPLGMIREQVAARDPATFIERVADFMWGDLAGGTEADVPGALAIFIDDENAPFMDLNRDDDSSDDEEDEEAVANDVLAGDLAPEVIEAAAAAGIDPEEVIDDAEDFDGVMELLGMRGPIAGLFQNAIFCAFLVSITIFLGIFLPYNIGRLAVWVVANPMRLVRMVLSFSRFVQDSCLFAVGCTVSIVFDFLYLLAKLLRLESARSLLATASSDARLLTVESSNRIWASIAYETSFISSTEIVNFSVVSHEALVTVKSHVHALISASTQAAMFVLGGNYAPKWEAAKLATATSAPYAVEVAKNITRIMAQPSSWMINLTIPDATATFDPSLVYWSAKDRTLAILGGYLSMSLLAGLYLGRGTPFSTGNTAQEWEASVIDVLNQASGVMKVILIISIEMLVFPLYCGLLLDFALLPLFEDTTFKSRLLFTYHYPLTSIFVHWFVGTGYMFHFALFVSMCRKIMRKGVLYFIRDPDDPEFHPVRDVLERNVTTQLRKILFSAFVYGALVVICLGGVVWGLSLAIPSVLPIHYSSNEPVLEFPIDLLFYNFLMPLAVKFFKPSDGLHVMYTWWFRRCARALHLSWFLFGERRIDEEGSLQLLPKSVFQEAPWYRKLFLDIDEEGMVVPKTWNDIFEGGKAKPATKIPSDKMNELAKLKSLLVETNQLIPDGRFVRAPASDQVKIPKGRNVFMEVSDRDEQLGNKPDSPEPDIYSGNSYQFVYVPPWFRIRIFLFIMFIWWFAAVTGVAFTIVPLVFGRRMFKLLLPGHVRTNDIYAFSIGMYILGSLGYFVFHAQTTLAQAREYLSASATSVINSEVRSRALKLIEDGAKLAYTYTMLLIVFPLAVALIAEFYVMIPLRTWRYSHVFDQTQPLKDGHTVNIVQAWTLGLLYLKIGTRLLVRLGGRPAQAARAVLRRGWMEPNLKVLTRAFVVPGVLMAVFLLAFPPLLAHALFRQGIVSVDPWTPEKQVVAYRMAYPIAALGWAMLWILKGIFSILDSWRARVRDEAYLIGERLHNFGGMVGTGTRGATAGAAGDWRGGARL
ncbi:hypothetical protein TruAng_005341 [Truncatella angustata]|nr:hypothetical protein TruAng_005341 [Truncatella angustata]